MKKVALLAVLGSLAFSQARAEDLYKVYLGPLPEKKKVEEVTELPRNFFELGSTFRLDGSNGGYNGALHYGAKSKNGLGVNFLGTAFHGNPDFINYANESGLDGMVGVEYKGFGLESGVGSNDKKRKLSKVETKEKGSAIEEIITRQDKEIASQNMAFGLGYKQLVFQFAAQPSSTDAHTKQVIYHTEPGITVKADVGQDLTLEENNKKVRFGALFSDENGLTKSKFGCDFLISNHKQKSINETYLTVISTVGNSSDTTESYTHEKNEIRRDKSIARLKGEFDSYNSYGHAQVEYCLADAVSAGAANLKGTLAGTFEKGIIGALSFDGDFYKGERTKGMAGVGVFYSAQNNAFNQFKEISSTGYEIPNSIVYSDKQKETIKSDLKSRLFASLRKGVGGAINFILNKDYRPGIEAVIGGAYHNSFGHLSVYASDATQPGKFSSAQIEAGYKNVAVNYKYDNMIPLDINDLIGKDNKKHTIEIKYHF